MPSNEERREVAARLREFAADCKDEACDSMHFAMYACWSDKGVCEAHNTSEALARLADLIEPEERTCRNQSKDFAVFWCSDCGYFQRDVPCAKYCPKCGAKVVQQ